MSRLTLEPLMAFRHLSNPPSSPRKALQSRLLATFDRELEKMNSGDATSSSDHCSNTMKMALGPGGDGGSKAMRSSHVPQTSIPPFFPKPSRVTSGATIPSTETETRTSDKHDGDNAFQESRTDLPLYTYKSTSPPPTRYYVRDEVRANELVSKLQGPLGFDMEWRVIFGPRMIQRKTAVLQLSDENMILVLQLAAMKSFPQGVKEIIERQDIIKMGVNILNDGRKLLRDYGIMSAGLLEMSHLARLVDPSRVTSARMISLQRIVEMYTGCTLSKGSVRTSNWEVTLNEEQLEYAANDAHSALKVYTELMRMGKAAGLDLKPAPLPRGSPMGVTFVPEPSLNLGRAGPKGASRRAPSFKPTSKAEGKLPMAGNNALGKGVLRVPGEAVHVTSIEQLQPSEASTKKRAGGQLLRAYKLWHEEQLPLPDICGALRSPDNPLTKGTVITYVVEALKADVSLPFSRVRLSELVQSEPASSRRHGWDIRECNNVIWRELRTRLNEDFTHDQCRKYVEEYM